MEDARKLVFAILQFFDEQQRSPNLSPDAIESLEGLRVMLSIGKLDF